MMSPQLKLLWRPRTLLRAPQDLMRSLPSSSQGWALEGRGLAWGTDSLCEGRGEGPRDPPVSHSDLALKLTRSWRLAP